MRKALAGLPQLAYAEGQMAVIRWTVRIRPAYRWVAMLVVCAGIAWVLYSFLRPHLPGTRAESDPILEQGPGLSPLMLRENLRDARGVIPARPHPLPFRPDEAQYAERITRRMTFLCSSNSAGFRGTREYGPAPAAGVVRVAAVGDSITFGYGVADEQTYPHLLDERLGPGFEVLNAGVPGHDSTRTLWDLQNRVLPLRPRVVIACTGVNEMLSLPERSEPERAKLWLSESQYRSAEARLGGNLETMHRACSDAGAHLVLLVPPVNTLSPFPDSPRMGDVVREAARRLGVPCLDLEAEFRAVERQRGLVLEHGDGSQTLLSYAAGEPEVLLTAAAAPDREQYIVEEVYALLDREPVAPALSIDDCHPNPDGHRFIAESLEPLVHAIAEVDER
jgi:lysophospholipase L1-like esterase